MKPEQVKIRAEGIAKLRAEGVEVPDGVSFPGLTKLIEQHTGRKITRKTSHSSFIYVFVHPVRASLRSYEPRPEWKPDPHPRQADIERAQPPLWTPGGIGNYNQYSQYMRDNGRSK